jgi:hypothetical protein
VALRTVDQAIARAMTAAREALRSDDPDEVNGVHLQLSKNVEEMKAAAANVDGELFSEANEMLREAEKTLRKLWRRKQEPEAALKPVQGHPSVTSHHLVAGTSFCYRRECN